MPKITLAEFEEKAVETLLDYASIPCLSPMFDENWRVNGKITAAMKLLGEWAAQRQLIDFKVAIHQSDERTPILVITVEATAPVEGTAVLYGHMDKQPPLGDWSDGLAPFNPVRRDDRIYARGVADDGYAIFAALLALESIEAHGIGHSRIVVLIEASEESGSTDLEFYLDALHEHLGAVELMICLDSGALTYDRLWVTTSLRGVLNVEIRIDVLERGQHSGSASGVVASSFRILRQLLDRVENAETGEVRIRELYAEVPEAHVAASLATEREFGDVVAREIPSIPGLVLMGHSAADRLLRRTWFPTLSIVGMGGVPDTAIAGNVLRPWTSAVLSLRLPPSVDATAARAVLERVLTQDVPSGARVTLSSWSLGDGWVSPPLEPWLRDALTVSSLDAFGHEPGFIGEGGSIPFLASLGRRFPNVQFVATGVLGPGSNAHGIDEMLDLPAAVGVTNSVVTLLGAYATHKGAPS